MERSLGAVPAVDDELEVPALSGALSAVDSSSDSSLNESDVTKASPLNVRSRHRLARLVAKFCSMSDPLMVKVIFLLLLFSLVLNILIMARIWEIETKISDNESPSDATIAELSASNFRLFIDRTIATVRKIESNLVRLRHRVKDEL